MALAIRDKIRQKAAFHLQPGETVQAVFAGQTFSQYWSFLSILLLLIMNGYRSVVVTDQRILVFDTGKFSQANIKRVIREVPRNTQIGPGHGLWYRTEALGERLYIHRRFFKDLDLADRR